MEKKIAVIGGGPGGYVAAIRAAQLGAKVTLFEKDAMGGTCTNKGCIPTKTLLESADLFERLKRAKELGVTVQDFSLDYAKVVERKDKIVRRLVNGVTFLMQKNDIQVVQGAAFIAEPGLVGVTGSQDTFAVDDIIIATGSQPSRVPIPGADGKDVLNSDGVLQMTELPESVVIIGGGYIGLEFSHLFASLGCKTTVIEMMPQLIPNVDEEIAKTIARLLKRKRAQIFNNAAVTGIEDSAGGKLVTFKTEKGVMTQEAQKVMIVVGRSPKTAGLGLDDLGVKVEKGRILVDEYMQTNVPGIYAVGDAVGGIMLAHVASAEAECAVENIFGAKEKMSYRVVPSCIYTTPEISSVGITEKQAAEVCQNPKTVKFPLTANGRSMIYNETNGFIKMVADGGQRRDPGGAHHRAARHGDDRRSRPGHADRGHGHGYRAHHPPPSHGLRIPERGGPGGQGRAHPHLR